MAIRYDDELKSRIRRTVKAYQNKRRRVLRRGDIGADFVPKAAFVSDFLNEYVNRRELLKDLQRLERYSERGIENVVTFDNGLSFSQYELNELQRRKMSGLRNMKRELNQAPNLTIAQPLLRSHYENLQLRYDYLKRDISKLTARQFRTYQRIAIGESDLLKRRRTFFNNIWTMVDQITFGMPDSLVREFRRALGGLSMKQLTDLVQNNQYLNSILGWYDVMVGGGRVSNLASAITELTEYINAL